MPQNLTWHFYHLCKLCYHNFLMSIRLKNEYLKLIKTKIPSLNKNLTGFKNAIPLYK